MKHFTCIITVTLTIISGPFFGQQARVPGIESNNSIKPQNPTASIVKLEPEIKISKHSQAGKSAVTSICSDDINYVGNTASWYINMRGVPANSSQIRGLFQVFPSYQGTVTGVEFDASKFNTPNTPTVYVAIFPVTSWGEPDISIQSTPVPVIINNTSATSFSVTLPTPVLVTGNNGFAVGVYKPQNSTDSIKMMASPIISGAWTYYSYLLRGNILEDLPAYFGSNFNVNMLFRPTVITTAEANWLTAKTSTGCALPAVYEFDNTSPNPPSYSTNTMICPGGVTDNLDYGDGSPATAFNTWSTYTHSYSTAGTYTATFTRSYVGWTNTCAETKSLTVSAIVPQPSFTYTVNGFNVIFTNTSANMSSFIWNFGDLTTSTQQDPVHTFASPGTYVVELEGTAPCGKVKHIVSIIITGDVGIAENTASNGISLYPNPVNSVLKISSKGSFNPNTQIEIYNSIGSVVKTMQATANAGSATVDVSDLSKGLYFIKVKNESGDSVKAFVKE